MYIFRKQPRLCIATINLLVALFRNPAWGGWANFLFWLIVLISSWLILVEVKVFRKAYRRSKKRICLLTLVIAWFSLSLATAGQVKFMMTQSRTLNTVATSETIAQPTPKVVASPPVTPTSLGREILGQHFIVGYPTLKEGKALVEDKAVSGLFINAINVGGKTKEQIKKEMEILQGIRKSQGLPPLWIAADQEGGVVSRLSPPLTKLPSLGRVIEDDKDIEQQKDKVIEYATKQAKELAEIGVNLNFAPVVDLNKNIRNPTDKHSKIYQRAISTDKQVVAKVALWYCQTLEKYGIRCTIKHFPGLGRVKTDTHVGAAELSTPVAELTQDDWVPFREVMQNSSAFTMLGHAKLTAVDPENPVSFSQKVVNDLIRKEWQYDGVLITDDFGMEAVERSKDGIKNAAVKALNAGVDLILIASGTNLYDQAMQALLEAEKAGKLDRVVLMKSKQRLDRFSAITPPRVTSSKIDQGDATQ